MRNLNKIAIAFCSAALGLMTMTSCEGGDLFSVDSPDWIAAKADSIAAEKAKNQGGEIVIEGLQEDVYNIGNAEFTAPFFTLGKTYVIPAGQKWQAQFNLTVNPDNKYYKNFFIVVNAYADGAIGDEYFVMRYDNDPNKNSEWNTTGTEFDRSLVGGNFTNASGDDDLDASVQAMNGKVTLTVDRANGGLYIEMNNTTLKKTYTQTKSFPSTGSDIDLAVRVGVEGSLVNFLGSTIEPIGGFTSKEDKQPIGMKLNGVPQKVMQGTSLEDAFANVTATIQFEQGVSLDVKAADLTFQAIPDMNTLGKKTLVAAYAKTYKGEAANAPVIGSAEFSIVDKMYTCVGASDNSSPFFGERSGLYKIAPNETFVSTFTSYNAGGVNNWENFLVVLSKQDLTLGADGEYAVLRADNYGWGNGYGTCTATCSQTDWDAWRAAMNGAKVTAFITNNGDGTADVSWVAIGSDGVTYTQSYTGITVSDPNDFNMSFTIEKSHIEFDSVVGAEDNSSAFFGARSDLIQVPAGKTYTRHFINYNAGGVNNWENFLVVLSKQDLTLGADGEYAVLRADNYGWGNGYGTCTPTCSHSDWDAWRAAINGASITLSVTNVGDGTANVSWIAIGSDGNTYTQSYTGITVSDPADMWMSFTIEKAHIVFE